MVNDKPVCKPCASESPRCCQNPLIHGLPARHTESEPLRVITWTKVWETLPEVCVCSVIQLCPTLCDPTDYSPPGSSVHGIFQTRILDWVAISSSRASSQPRDQTSISCVSFIGRQIPYHLGHLESLPGKKKIIGTSAGEKRAQCREGEIQETGKGRNSQDNSYSTWGQSWTKQVEPRMRTNGWRLQQPRPVVNLPPRSILETQCSCFKQLPLLNLNHYVRKIELQSVPEN